MQPTLKLSLIVQGKNPRTHFDLEEMESLTSSIAESGVLQPILVRPRGDGTYEIVAGERRYRAALSLFGENYDIPVVIKEMTDEEAEAAAFVENYQRADMSATEEAAAAAKLVGRFNGDRDEAAKRLGLTRSALDRRLALMNCSESVQIALNTREIKFGHAELLATLAKASQDNMLPVIIKEKKSVSELKATIEKAACKLESAIFDKQECNACPHNSSLQVTMFEESITDGSCTNPSCFKDKTQKTIDSIAEGLKDEYPVIRIIRAGDNATRVKLEALGDHGVGEVQAEACKACANYGAAVSSLPQALGKVFKNQCFDPSCNAKKIAERITAERKANEPSDQSTRAKEKPSDADPKGKSDKAKVVGQPAPKLASVAEGERVKAYREKVWRTAMKKEVAQSADTSRKYLITLCLSGDARHINASGLEKAFEKITGRVTNSSSLDKTATLVSESEPAVQEKMITLMAASAMDGIDVSHLKQLAKFHQLDLTKYWALDLELLNLMTKSEIEFIAKEVGLDVKFGEGFKKLFSDKKEELISKLLSLKDFNYSAVIPKVIQY